MIIKYNASAAFANRELRFRTLDNTRNIERLSSGMRINRAGDDASGLSLSEKLRTQVRGLHRADRNIQDAISFIQTTEAYIQETQNILQRIRELSIQSANGIYSDSDRNQIQTEVSILVDEIDRVASYAEFNRLNMLTGRFAEGGPDIMQFHIGANQDQSVQVFIGNMSAKALGLRSDQADASVSISTVTAANNSIGIVDKALDKVLKQRADLGAYQNRFTFTQKSIAVAAENMAAAESQIRDTDMASELVDFVKNQVLTQTNMAMLAQANTQSETVLQLLG